MKFLKYPVNDEYYSDDFQVIRRASASRGTSNPFRRVPRPLQGTLAPPPRPMSQAKPQV